MTEEKRLPIRDPGAPGQPPVAIGAYRGTLEKAKYASPSAVERKCVTCEHTVVISQASVEILRKHPKANIYCEVCAGFVPGPRAQTAAQRLDSDQIRARMKHDPD